MLEKYLENILNQRLFIEMIHFGWIYIQQYMQGYIMQIKVTPEEKNITETQTIKTLS